MFELQTWNATRRPGKAADGPPYGPAGMWSTFARHETPERAIVGMTQVLDPTFFSEGRHRNAEDYRIVYRPAAGLPAKYVLRLDGTIQPCVKKPKPELARLLAA